MRIMNTFKITKEDLGVQEAPSAVKLAQEIYRELGSLCDEWEFEIEEEHLLCWLPKFLGGTTMGRLLKVVEFYHLSCYACYDTVKRRMQVSIYYTRK